MYERMITGLMLVVAAIHLVPISGFSGAKRLAAFTPSVQPLAFVAAAASLASFFYLAVAVGDYGPAIRKIVIGDVVAVVCLVAAILLYTLENRT